MCRKIKQNLKLREIAIGFGFGVASTTYTAGMAFEAPSVRVNTSQKLYQP